MPQFVKMGLHTTGFLGEKSSASRAAKRFANRRKVLNGYPITKPFENIEAVREYLSGDRIVCLLCGKTFKRLAMHLPKIHGMSLDQYREQYKIPWTYGLCSEETTNTYRKAWEHSGYVAAGQDGDGMAKMLSAKRRKCPHHVEIATKNITKIYGRDNAIKIKLVGNVEVSLEDAIHHWTSRMGSEEYRRKKRKNALARKEEVAKRFSLYWKGRKQSEAHVRKRIEALKRTIDKNKG